MMFLLDLTQEKQIQNREFQSYVEKAKSFISIWKRKYGYSGNDPRYLTATLTQILEDLLDDRAVDFITTFEARDEETNKYLKASTVKPRLIKEDQEQMKEEVKELMEELKLAGK